MHACHACGHTYPDRDLLEIYRAGQLHRRECKRCHKTVRRELSTTSTRTATTELNEGRARTIRRANQHRKTNSRQQT